MVGGVLCTQCWGLWGCVASYAYNRYHAVLTEVVTALHKTVDSLKTLKKMRRATAAAVTEDGAGSDEARVKAQMLDDVAGLAQQVACRGACIRTIALGNLCLFTHMLTHSHSCFPLSHGRHYFKIFIFFRLSLLVCPSRTLQCGPTSSSCARLGLPMPIPSFDRCTRLILTWLL